MSKARFVPLLSTLLLVGCARAPAPPPQPVVHEEMALAMAHKAWASVFTKTASETFAPATIKRFEPFTVTLENGEWMIRPHVPEGFHGTVPSARIRQVDGLVSVEGTQR